MKQGLWALGRQQYFLYRSTALVQLFAPYVDLILAGRDLDVGYFVYSASTLDFALDCTIHDRISPSSKIILQDVWQELFWPSRQETGVCHKSSSRTRLYVYMIFDQQTSMLMLVTVFLFGLVVPIAYIFHNA